MTFPTDPLDINVELLLDAGWTDITADVQQREDITITRGKQNEASSVQPSSMTLTVNNRLGKYTPSNPVGTYYGQIGRNTGIRATLRSMSAPTFDASTLGEADPFGDMLPFTHTPVTDRPTGVLIWMIRWDATTDESADIVITYGDKEVPLAGSAATTTTGRLYWYFLGEDIPRGAQTVTTTGSASTVSRNLVVITMTGGSETEINNTVGLTSNTTANPSQNVTTTENTLIFGALHSGQDAIGSVAPGTGYTDVVEDDLGTSTMSMIRRSTAATAGTTAVSWTALADTWSVVGIAVAAISRRFVGEVASWPAKWDTSGNDAFVQLECAGILRRAKQGNAPSVLALEDRIRSLDPHKYWPLDEPFGYTWTQVTGGSETDGSSYAFGRGSLGPYLPQALSVGTVTTPMVAYTTSSSSETEVAVDFVFMGNVGAAKTLNVWYEEITQDLSTPGSSLVDMYWKLQLRYDGVNNDITFSLEKPSGNVALGNTGILTELSDGLPHHVRILLERGAALTTDWSIYLDGAVVLSATGQAVDGDLQNINSVVHLGNTSTTALWNFGHLAVWAGSAASTPDLTANDIILIIQGYAGETAGNRAKRLIQDIDYSFAYVGDLDSTVTMGPQYGDSFPSQLTEIERTDLGMVYEPRASLGVGYRTRQSLYNQDATVTIDYSGNELAPPFEPVYDDQNIRNDIFAQRRDGGSYQATLETGPLSILDPPNGVGRYKDEAQVNTETDQQLGDIAGFLLGLGTVDGARFPNINVDRSNPNVAANSTLMDALLKIDLGDKLTITNASAAGFYDDIEQLMLGYTEVMNWKTHTFKFNCVPASPYAFAVWGDTVGAGPWRYDALDATIAEDLDTTETTVTIAYGSIQWTQEASEDFDINIGGERMTVTAVGAPAAGNQDLTVTRSVNGVVKTHTTGADVRLWDTPRFGF